MTVLHRFHLWLARISSSVTFKTNRVIITSIYDFYFENQVGASRHYPCIWLTFYYNPYWPISSNTRLRWKALKKNLNLSLLIACLKVTTIFAVLGKIFLICWCGKSRLCFLSVARKYLYECFFYRINLFWLLCFRLPYKTNVVKIYLQLFCS